MIKQLLKLLAVMAVLLPLVAVPVMGQTQNGPLIATRSNTGEIDKIDPTTGGLTVIPGAIGNAPRFPGSSPSVTPDGKTVVYSGDVGGNSELFSVPIDGSAAPTQITSTVKGFKYSFKRSPVVSPDGQTVYFNWDRYRSDRRYERGLYSVPIGGGKPTQIVAGVYLEGMKITPDGQYLVYLTTDADGNYKKVEAMSVKGGPSHTVVDNTQSVDLTGFGQSLSISPDGKTIVMTGIDWGSNSASLYTAPFSPTTTHEATILSGTTVTPASDSDTGENNSYVSAAFSPDGQSIAYNLWSVRPEIGTFLVEEIRSVPATGGTPTVIVPFGGDSTFLHQDLLWAPQVGTG